MSMSIIAPLDDLPNGDADITVAVRTGVGLRRLQQLDTADRQEPSEALKTKTSRLKEKIAKLKERGSQGTNACHAGSADLADRS